MDRKVVQFMLASLVGTFAGNLVRAVTSVTAYYGKNSIFFLAFFVVAFMFGRGLAALVSGKIFDLTGDNKIVVFSFFSLAVVNLAYLYVNIDVYSLLRFLSGILSGFAWPTVQSLLLVNIEESFKSRAMSLYFIAGSIGAATAYIFLGIYSSTELIVAGSLLYFVTPIPVLKYKGNPRKNKGKEKENVGSGKPVALFLLSIELGLMSAILSTDIMTGILLNLGYSKFEVGLILSISSYIGLGLGLPLSYYASHITDYKGAKLPMVALATLFSISAVFMLAIRNIFAVYICLVAMRISIASYRPILISLAKAVFGTGVNIGVINFSYNINTVLNSLLLGYLLDNCEEKYAEALVLLVLAISIFVIARGRKVDKNDGSGE